AFVKRLQSPQVLHVATHGYFVGGGKNPLLAGGFLLAQAAVWDSLFPPLGRDDGRLTAQEVSNLNLIGTELVVLSACETGLGEVRGEGLYGLQRAFLEAGAQRVITTLWQIDDEATRGLMLSFYQSWVKRKRREGVDEVFNRTLRTFREKHPEPYYWGAFVVMR
ncbi:MAG: CHAT domain-containing protein, partial [Bacteroidia bacterium]|nr:CHAT domain-containing protein [Bacteroidia bacterium]